MPRPTLSDVARRAGVSRATADRVLNGRAHVSPRTRDLVMLAARASGYLAPEDTGPAPRPARLLFLVPGGTNAFFAELRDQVAVQSAAMAGVTAQVETIDLFDPARLAERLFALKGRHDGIAVVALDHPMVREALRRLVAAGTHVVTLASDVTGVAHDGYIGIDNAQSGRLAGYLMGRFVAPPPDARANGSPDTTQVRPAPEGPRRKVAFFAGSLTFRGHQEREMGFRQVLGQDFPHLGIVVRHEVHEDRERARSAVHAVLAAHPDLAAIYNAGGATSGIVTALTEAGRAGDVVLIAHDITASNRAHLLTGAVDAVIDQNARAEITEALHRLTALVRRAPYRQNIPPLRIILRENLPDG